MNFNENIRRELKIAKNQGGIHTKLLITLLIIALKNQTSYQSSATTLYSYLMGRYENKFI